MKVEAKDYWCLIKINTFETTFGFPVSEMEKAYKIADTKLCDSKISTQNMCKKSQ